MKKNKIPVNSSPVTVSISTINTPPVANAGPSQTVTVGTTVQLDGSGSSDPDGDVIDYSWSITVIPDGIKPVLSDPYIVNPTFVAGFAGTFLAQLIVYDGFDYSNPSTVTITAALEMVSVPNVVGITQAAAQSAITAANLTLGTTTESNSDTVSAGIVISQNPMVGTSVPKGSSVNLEISLGPASVPMITSFLATPGTIHSGNSSSLSWSITGATSASIDQGVGSVNATSGTTNVTPLSTTPYTLTATNAKGSVTAKVTVTVIVLPTIDSFSATPGTINFGNSSTLNWSIINATSASIDNGIGSVGPVSGSSSVNPSSTTTYTLTATSAAGSVTAQVTVTVSGGPPPDPSTVAPPLDNSVPTSTHAATKFLYTGDNPIQTGVADGTIEAKRAAVLRGKVLDRDDAPLGGATISILNHPEYGQTLSRADGMFDLVVNGGGFVTINYVKNGFLKAQRQANVPWQDFVTLPDVVLIPLDPQVTSIDLSTPSLQVARGTVQTDGNGSRQATLLVPQGTTAWNVMPDGSTQSLTSLTIRATEYTVGINGPQAMPAELPSNVGYTYCVELTAEEAEQAGATRVQFSQPLPYYVENFLGFSVGTIVPSGYYDRQKAAWIPSPNGRVIKILGVTEGLADLDLNTTSGADPSLYAFLGITDAERAQLAVLYPVNQQLWRIPITHFTPWDLNWPIGPPDDAILPNQAPPDQNKPNCEPCKQTGSILECQNQVLGQEIPVTGTPFSLNYRSSHVSGRKEAYTLDIPLSGPSVPNSLGKIMLEVRVAGRLFKWNFPGAPNQSHTFAWDGKDPYGRIVQGRQPVNVRIGYEYPAVYRDPATLNSSFGSLSDVTLSGPSARQNITLWQEWKGYVGTWLSIYQGLGGFSLDIHHFYDRKGGILFRGDGGEYNAEAIASQVVNLFAGGTPTGQINVDGIPAIGAMIMPWGVAAGPDGSIYITHQFGSITHWEGGAFIDPTVLKITPDGKISTLPGFPAPAILGDIVKDVALGPDGSVYVSDTTKHKVYRYDPVTQTATVVAGTGSPAAGCEECPGATSGLSNPRGLAVGPDGTLYIADTGQHRIRKVDTNGIITTIVGLTGGGYLGDGGPASSAKLSSPYGLALGSDGSLYIADTGNYRIRRVGPDGIITTVAGTGIPCASVWNSCGDGEPASQAQLELPYRISVGPEGTLFITDGVDYDSGEGWARVRRVSPTGIISALLFDPAAPPTVTVTYGGGGRPPANYFFSSKQTAVGPDGSLYISGNSDGYGMVLKIHAPLKGLDFGAIIVPSKDGSEIYVFNAAGRHDRTLNAYTNSIIYQFYYDSDGRVIQVDDAYGNPTLIERNVSGVPTAIIGPFGQRTELTVNGDGYLASISDPASQTTSFTYTPTSGLMTEMTEPMGYVHAFLYDSDGRVIQDEDPNVPTHGIQTLTRSEFDTGYSVVHSTAEGRQTTYRVERLSNGNERQTNTFPTGAITTTNLSTTGSETITFADGSTSIPSKKPDPRFGLRAPLYKTTLKMPSNLEFNSESKRTVTLSDPSDLLSVETITEETTFDGARTYTLTYSAPDKKYTHTTAEGRTKAITVNDQGSITQIDFPGDYGLYIDPVTFTYNSKGFLTETVFGDIIQTFIRQTYNYDALGRVVTTTNAAGETISYDYDASNRVTAVTSPLENSYGFNYDANSNLTQITMPSGAAHSLSYNSLNLLSGYTPPYTPPESPQPYAWSYNKDRDLTRMTLPEGRIIDIGYDTWGRMSQVSYPEATVLMTYNDVTNRLFGITRTPLSGHAQQMDYTYDGSLLKSAAYTGVANGTYTYVYDNNYFLTGLALDSDSISIVRDKDGLVTSYGDFNFGREETLGLLTDIKDTTQTLKIDYTYDYLGRLAGRTHTVNGIQIYDLQLTRDNTGRITQKIDGSTYDYTYDADGQLTGVYKNGANSPQEQYVYDANANRISASNVTASYDAQDRILEQGGIVYEHNGDGFMTRRGSDTYFSYSARGELLKATVGSDVITYAYDGYGRRVGHNDGLGNWYQYFYGDPYNEYLVTATRDPGRILTIYYYDDFGHLFAFQRGGAWYYVATDQIGSPRVVSSDSGSIVYTREYDSYGNILSTGGTEPGFDLPIGFAGGINDSITGQVRFGARDYDPDIGRWTAKDPILFQNSKPNPYLYVQNNPVNLIDPKGLWSVSLDFYKIGGGGITIGKNPNGTWFVSGRLGVGFGGGGGVDLKGESPHFNYRTTQCGLVQVGVVGNLGAGIGPAAVGGTVQLGYSREPNSGDWFEYGKDNFSRGWDLGWEGRAGGTFAGEFTYVF